MTACISPLVNAALIGVAILAYLITEAWLKKKDRGYER